MTTIDCPKCEHEHEACGSHEDDSGEWECEECGFKFNVEIEYDPSYITTCVEHEYGHFDMYPDGRGNLVKCRFCVHCQKCELFEEGCNGKLND